MKKRDIDEYLETLWRSAENKESDIDNFRKYIKGEFNNDIIETLELKGYIKINKNKIHFTEQGEEKAKGIVRRHRLAERLLVDVLGMKSNEVETGACEFEHILAPEITDSICTLLGHPRQCPHGSLIPEGKCCTQKKETVSGVVISLDKGKVGNTYKVVYINTCSHSRIHKFVHFGINTGASVRLHQTYPSFVISCENGQLALEEDVAKDIYVWPNGAG